MIAVVPADRKIMLGRLSRLLGHEHLPLADEAWIAALFADCDLGAVPALGMTWGIETVVEDEIETNAVACIEGGDH